MASRTLDPKDPAAKRYEDLRIETEEHTRRIKAAKTKKADPDRPKAKGEEQQ